MDADVVSEEKDVSKADADLLTTARDRFKRCVERDQEQRLLQLRDLKFATLDQWEPSLRQSRENDIDGPRPCLTIDKYGQYKQQIINNIRKNKPAGKVRGVDDKADPATAQVFQGIVRHIDDISTTDIVYETAAEWAIDTGEGYWRYVTDFVPGKADEQEIYRRPIMDGFSVYLGPHNMPDGSDAQYAFIFEDIEEDEYKRLYPDAPVSPAMFDDEATAMAWLPDGMVRLAEYLYYDHVEVDLVRIADGSSIERKKYDEMPDPKPEITAERKETRKVVKWCKLTGTSIIEKRDWAGKYLPVVKVTGHQKMVEGKVKRWGLIRPAIDPCRLYNWTASVIAERVGLSPLNQYIASEGQISGREKEWAESNRVRRAVLLYKREDLSGNATPPPQRSGPIQVDSQLANLLQLYEHDIQTALGMFKASVGEEQGDQSGRAIRALQTQSDTATFHFPNNLGISIRRGLEIEIDLIPKIYDTARVQRIIGEDGKAKQVYIDPQQEQSVRNVVDQQGNVIKTIYNLGVGTYDVTATVGPSYATGRQEVAELTHEAMKNNPALVPLIGDLAYRALDNPVADQIADRLKKMLPPPLQDDGKGPQIPPQVAQQMEQMKQGMQQLQQENQQLKAGTMEGMAKVQADAKAKEAALSVQAQQDQQELALKAQRQAEELRLAREKVEAEYNLKVWQAQQDAELDRMKAARDAEMKNEEVRRTIEAETLQANAPEAVNQKMEMTKVVETLTQLIAQQQDLTAQVAEKLGGNKQISLKMPDGRVASATVTLQ